MYLKEISATGFKSFAEKITISLDGKTTCIVGPNGSGKSNIVDAVRWVLGEQSVKSLRGEGGMSDVIFSGSNSRKPLNVASVELTFDNSDNYLKIPYNEVCVKRRVYRTGENEYFLNGERCRLKDITDLFMDSGIGRDSFNIISQGEIAKILSNSAYDRRQIFEEAAGVLKYKKRKEEALRKLERTKNNLSRVRDIIEELEVQVNPLKEQSKKALEYLDNKDKLKNVEVALITYEIENINHNLKNSQERVEEINTNLFDLGVELNNSDTDILKDKHELNNRLQELDQMNIELINLTKREEQLNGEKLLLKERSKYKSTDSKVHENIQLLKERELKVDNGIFLAKKDLSILNSDLDTEKETLNKKEIDLSNLKNRLSNLNIELSHKRRDLIELDHRIEVLNNSVETGSSLYQSVRKVLNNPRLTGINQVIGNLVSTTDELNTALEVALLATKQYIVTDDEESAKRAINYLKENNLGRASFFPLTTIKGKYIANEIVKELKRDEDYIGLFIDLVTYDEKYKNIISNQLGNVIVARSIDGANRLSRLTNQRYKVVTLDGGVVNVGGSITGGSLNNAKSIISERRLLEESKRLREDIKGVCKGEEEEIEQMNKEIRDKELNLFEERAKVSSLEEKIKVKGEQLENLNLEKEEITKEVKSLGLVVSSSLSQEEEKVLNDYYEVSREKDELVKTINLKTREKDALSAYIDEKDAGSKLLRSKVQTLEKELRDLEINNSKMDVKLDSYLNTLNEDYELTFEKAKEDYVLEVEVDEAREMVNMYKSNIRRLGMVNLAAIDEYQRVSGRYEFLTNQEHDLLGAKDTLLEIIDEMDRVMVSEFKATFEKIEVEFKKVFQQLFNGGNASIKMTDPNNVLETGIDIVASPPGKKLTSISLLSGGEKTLTAISLIFAILNIRTIPFCLFDEVEAALDEANVDQFGHYLNNYKDKTQFLIITHKKKTMEYADTLYGITMQESGVSKLVSVKLDKVGR